mmetsp:Transcript_24431/g.31767  ORF Transcript_24431/g.31767 Transcript_24431/m.31767 type:complete len:403 (-) Transcript_24431:200-1408(-)
MSGRLIRTAPTDSHQAVNPDRMEKFLDKTSPWGLQSFSNKQSSNAKKSTRPRTLYDPTLSWDGLSANPQTFSKFDIDPRVTGKHILAGTRLLETSSELPDGVFEGVSNSKAGINQVPRTLEQRDCEFNPAERSLADSAEQLSLSFSNQRFMNMQMESVKVGSGTVSDIVSSSIKPNPAGLGELKRYLLTPEERRHILKCEIEDKAARELAKKAQLQHRRLVQVLRDRYPQGAIRVDGINNIESDVYSDRALSRMEEHQRKEMHTNARRDRLRDLTMQEPRFGHDPFKHNEELLPPHETKFIQSKKVRPGVRENTQDNLFGTIEHRHNTERMQELRNRDLNGKNYNLVSKTKIEHWQCTTPDHSQQHDYSFMSHPSQASLESQRSLQGVAHPPGDRSTGMVIF